MSAKRRQLTPNGGAWLRGLHVPAMNLPEAIVSSIIFFDSAPDKDVMADAFEQTIWKCDRCSSCVVDGYFVKVEGAMDRSYHFTETSVQNEAAIDAFAQKVMSEPLDRKYPLWKATILKSKQGRSAVVLRFHHVISDGLGLLFAFLPMMRCDDGKVIDNIPLPALLLGKKVSKKCTSGAEKGLCWKFLSIFHGVYSFFRGILSLLIMRMDAAIKINAPHVERKPFLPYTGAHRFTRMPPVPLSLIKVVREKHGCTVNDVLMCGLAGAIRRYCANDLGDTLLGANDLSDPLLGKQVQKVECKCSMLLALPRPVDPKDPGASMCNNILTPILKLPVDDPLPVGRLRRTVSAINDLKSKAFIAGISMTTKFITAVAPVKLAQQIASEAISKLTCNVTSVPMTTVPVQIWGKELKEVHALFVNNIPQISMVSYNGFVNWNIIADPNLIPDPFALGKHLISEIQDLANEAPPPQ